MNIIQRIMKTREKSLQQYLEGLEGSIKVKKKEDREELAALKRKMVIELRHIKAFRWTRIFFYVLLYASVVSNLLSDFAVFGKLSSLATPLLLLSSIIGTTISLAMVLLLTKFMNTYWEDVRTYATHMIAIYTKHEHIERILR